MPLSHISVHYSEHKYDYISLSLTLLNFVSFLGYLRYHPPSFISLWKWGSKLWKAFSPIYTVLIVRSWWLFISKTKIYRCSKNYFRRWYFHIHFPAWFFFIFWLQFHWSLFIRVQLTISQHYPKCCPNWMTHICGTRGRWVKLWKFKTIRELSTTCRPKPRLRWTPFKTFCAPTFVSDVI